MAKKALVLAAGFGTRLRPFTCTTPKPLLPIWGVAMLERAVGFLRDRGVDEITVNCHYLADKIEEWCGANGCRVSREETILGTGGALDKLRDWIGGDDFYLVNGDIVFDGVPDLEAQLERSAPEVIGVAAITEFGPRTIEVEPESRYVTCWSSPDPGWEGTWTFCGISLFRAGILDYIERGVFSPLTQAFEKAMMEGKFIKGVAGENLLWEDAGTIDSYIALNSNDEENAFADLPQIKLALEALKLEEAKIEFRGARGSDRAFFKLNDDYLIIYDDSKRGENAKYASHAKWLAEKGIKVPRVLFDSPEAKTLVLESAGVEDLQKRAARRGEDRLWDYVAVVEELARFNNLDASALDLEPRFDSDLYKWERELFAEQYLKSRHNIDIPEAVAKELVQVASKLEKEPLKLVHRDFQSSNIIWSSKIAKTTNGEFKIIDFQGMRLGPAAYDLASLLYDPYVDLREGERKALAALYAKKSGYGEIAGILPFAAVERLVQALGAYGRLTAAGKGEFAKYILPALENLLAAADAAGLEATGGLAEDLIAKEQAREKKALHSCSCSAGHGQAAGHECHCEKGRHHHCRDSHHHHCEGGSEGK